MAKRKKRKKGMEKKNKERRKKEKDEGREDKKSIKKQRRKTTITKGSDLEGLDALPGCIPVPQLDGHVVRGGQHVGLRRVHLRGTRNKITTNHNESMMMMIQR